MDTDKKFRFRNFPVYKDARTFSLEIKAIAMGNFPPQEQFSLTNQIRSALNSIALNIAEGSSRNTDKDFAHFLNMACASVDEVVACLDVALDDGYIDPETHNDCMTKALKLANQITAFRRSLVTRVKGQM